MITRSELMEIIKKYAASDEGRQKIKRIYGVDYDPKFNKNTAKKYGARLKQILFDHINPVIKSITMDDIIVGDPYKDADGFLNIEIGFREDKLRRESLVKDIYPDGLTNIILLFTKGYHARNSVRGIWRNSKAKKPIRSKTDREPNDFLQKAVDAFNAEALGVATATLDQKYE